MRTFAMLALCLTVTAPALARAQQPSVQAEAERRRAATAQDTAALPPQEVGTIAQGQTRSGLLEAGDWTMSDGTFADIWYVNMVAGQRVVIELRSRAFDAYLQLLDPWGGKLSEDDDGAGSGDARITFQAREPGRYQVVVNNFGDTPQTGAYSLSVR
jgi:serine protease Do